MDSKRLTATAAPWFHLWVNTPAELSNAVRALEQIGGPALRARVIRGRKAMTKEGLLNELAAALQFPLYFGENWDALLDCLRDLAWLHPGAVTLCIADAAHVLANAPPAESRRFLEVLNDAAQGWNQPAASRKAMPFHVVLHATPADEAALAARVRTLGVTANRMG